MGGDYDLHGLDPRVTMLYYCDLAERCIKEERYVVAESYLMMASHIIDEYPKILDEVS